MTSSTARSGPNLDVVEAPDDPKRTTALVDRLMHHAHVLVTDGDSIRLADAMAGKGVAPLA